MATVRYGIPTLPKERRLYSARPAYGADATRFADALNHIAGYRFARLPPAIVEPDATGVSAVFGEPGGPQAADTVRFVHRVSSQFPYLWLTLDYQMDDEGTGGPSITASVTTIGGVAVDVGVRWSLATGTVAAASSSGILGTSYPIQTLTTPTRVPGAGEATAGAPTIYPRLLDVSSVAATGGGLVEVTVACVQARIVSGSVLDWPTGEV